MKYDGMSFGEKWAETRVREEHRLAAERRLAREARGGHPSRLAERWNALLCRVGTALEGVGQRLQQRADLPILPIRQGGDSDREAQVGAG